jgi:hypothetical protein
VQRDDDEGAGRADHEVVDVEAARAVGQLAIVEVNQSEGREASPAATERSAAA